MTDLEDPFDALRLPFSRIEPSPELRERVRAELRRAAAGANADLEPLARSAPAVVIGLDAVTARRSRRRTFALAAVGAAAVVVLLAVATIALRDDREPVDVSGTRATTTTILATTGPLPVETLESLGASSTPVGAVNNVAVSGDAVIVVRYFGDPAAEIYDAATGTRRQVIEGVAGASRSAFGSFWVASSDDAAPGTVKRIDASTGALLATVQVDSGLHAWAPSAVDDTGVWYVSYRGELVHLSATTNSVDRTLKGPDSNVNGLAYGDGSLWAVAKKRISRIDPTNGTLLASIEIPSGVYPTATVTGTDLWVYGSTDADSKVALYRFDTATNQQTAAIATDGTNTDNPAVSHMAVDSGYVWITTDQAALLKVDPSSNTVIGRYGEDLGPASIATAPGTIWLTSRGPQANLYRIPLG